jgi:hypothetical protein
MAQPSSALTRWDASLNTAEFDLMMNQRGFIGPRVLKPRSVGNQSATYGKISVEELLRSQDTARRARAGYGRDTFEVGNTSFSTAEYGWEAVVDDREKKVYRDLVDQEATAMMRAAAIVCDDYERAVADAVFNTTTWNGASLTTAVSTPWATHASATPIADIIAAADKVALNCGQQPNALILNWREWMNMLQCASVKSMLATTKDQSLSNLASAVAALCGLEQIIVANGIKNTANKGQTASLARIWADNYAMIAKVATTDDPKEICLGRTWMFSEENAPGAAGDGSTLAVVMEEYRDEATRGSIYRARNDRQVQVLYAECGHLLTSV